MKRPQEFTITPLLQYEDRRILTFVVPRKGHPVKSDIVIVEGIRYIVLMVFVQNNQASGIPNITRPFNDDQVGLAVFKETQISTARPQ